MKIQLRIDERTNHCSREFFIDGMALADIVATHLVAFFSSPSFRRQSTGRHFKWSICFRRVIACNCSLLSK